MKHERASRENMRDDKNPPSGISAFDRVLPRTYMSREIGGCQGKRLYNEHRDPPGSRRMREEGKIDRDKADAIITIFFFFTRAVFPAGNYTRAPSTWRRVASFP